MLAKHHQSLHPGAPVQRLEARRRSLRKCICSSEDFASLQLVLKEWLPVVSALKSGRQQVLLRKGGIREPAFQVKGRQFLLLGTAFHTVQDLLQPDAANKFLQDMQHEPKHDRQLTIDCVAEITGAWHTQDPHILTALHHHHIWSEAFIDTRLRWRPRQVITALELRCRQLQQPLVVQTDAKYWGCFSWCELERGAGPAQLHDATPALDDRAFETQQAAIREALQSIECTQVSLTT